MTGNATLPCCDTTITSLSEVPLPELCSVIFDLDDTIYPERDFVNSGFRAVAAVIKCDAGECVFERLWKLFDEGCDDPFGEICDSLGLDIPRQTLIDTYRYHFPGLKLAPSVARLLTRLKACQHKLGLLTDGRSATQRNKIRALGLENWIDEIVISEEFGSTKPAERNYRYFESRFRDQHFVYVGDNLAKDFWTPNRLGWFTVGVRDCGNHIHSQAAIFPVGAMPKIWVEKIA